MHSSPAVTGSFGLMLDDESIVAMQQVIGLVSLGHVGVATQYGHQAGIRLRECEMARVARVCKYGQFGDGSTVHFGLLKRSAGCDVVEGSYGS